MQKPDAAVSDHESAEEEVKGEVAEIQVLSPEELQGQSQQSWDKFYKHNQDKFFKNRNYLRFAFELIDQKIAEAEGNDVYLFEVGCGTGSTVIPLQEKYKDSMKFYACDFSPNAIKILDSLGVCEKAFVKDMVSDKEISEFPDEHIDFITMIFFLSAIHP